ncbi:hypothetical protein BDW16_0463 [Sphingomonas koreensis]|nr:hypothetical protein BDW16_0463 [Sphingomonas koreensis]
MLLLGALVGLFGVETAYAVAPPPSAAPAAMQNVDADCMEIMQKQSPPAQAPCKGITFDCIAAMGCILPMLAHDTRVVLAVPGPAPAQTFWPIASVLIGTDLLPEQHPPTVLG